MSGFWERLSTLQQDILLLVLLLLPAFCVGAIVLRGFRPGPLVRAMLWRFRWVNLVFVALIAVSVGIGVGLLAQERGLRRGTAASAEKFDLVVAAPGSEFTMLLAAVYLQPSDVPLLPGDIFDEVAEHEQVSIAAPLAFGDSFQGVPVVGTTAEFVIYLSDDAIQGRMFQAADEAIAGASVQLEIGDEFVPAHGRGAHAEAEAHEAEIVVVGQMAPTGTPWDRSLIVPIESVWSAHELPNGHAPERTDQIGPPFDKAFFPGTPAIIVHAEELWANYALRSDFTREAEMMAFFPGAVLAQLYSVMGDIRQAMSVMSLTTHALVATSVLVGLLMLIRLFKRQLALLRVLGAPIRFVFAVVWLYAASLLLTGTALGILVGHAATIVLSRLLTERTDILIQAPLAWSEFHLVAVFVSISTFLALLPAVAIAGKSLVSSIKA